MPTVHLYYDGWLTLPVHARRHLDVAHGDQLEIELVGDGLLLRPVAPAERPARTAPDLPAVPPAAQPAAATPAVEAAPPARGRGRPRKLPQQDLAPRIKVGGRRRSTAPA